MQKRDTREAWQISPSQFPDAGSLEAKLEFLLRYAILAPSSHNTQPWRFRISDGGVNVYADRSRALPVIDPLHRQLLMSCGGALLNLRIAMRRFGWLDMVDLFPEKMSTDFLARVTPGPVVAPAPGDIALCDAIPLRHTNRKPFRLRPVSQTIGDELIKSCAKENAWLVRLHPTAKYSAADLISLADRDQFADKSFRKELSEWLVSNSSQRGDGIPGYSKSYGPTTSYGTGMLVRTFDVGGSVAASEKELVEGSPMLSVLGTTSETPQAWLEAGQAMQRMLLTGQLHGLSTSFLNQPLELANYRAQFSALTEHEGYPQLIMRTGYGPETVSTPRRSLADVLES